MVSCVRLDGTTKQFRIQKLFGFLGLKRIEIEEPHKIELTFKEKVELTKGDSVNKRLKGIFKK